MTSKNEQLYKAVLLSLKDILPNFNPSSAMCNFEKSSRNALRSVYPSINLIGCWFHFPKAIYDKTVVKYKITNMYIMILRTLYLNSAQSINIDYPLASTTFLNASTTFLKFVYSMYLNNNKH